MAKGSGKSSSQSVIVAVIVIAVAVGGFYVYNKMKSEKQAPKTAVEPKDLNDKRIKQKIVAYLPEPLLKTGGDPLIANKDKLGAVKARLATEKFNYGIELEDNAKLLEADFDFALLTPFDTIKLLEARPDTQVLLEATLCHFQVKVFVKEGSAISGIEQLSGKAIGTPVSVYPGLYLTMKPFEQGNIIPSKAIAYSSMKDGLIAVGNEIDAFSIAARVAKDNQFMVQEVPKGLSQIYESKYYLPCRFLVEGQRANVEAREHLLNMIATPRQKDQSTASIQVIMGLNNNSITTPASIEMLKKELTWNRQIKVEVR